MAIKFDDNFCIEGYWHIPNTTEEVFGELRYSPGKSICLHTAGSLLKLSLKDSHNKEHHVEIIHGISSEGDIYSLVNCVVTDLQSSSATQFVNYKCQYILQGIHLKSWNQASFKKIKAQICGLSDWCNVVSIDEMVKEFPSKINDVKICDISLDNVTTLSINKSMEMEAKMKDEGISLTILFYTYITVAKKTKVNIDNLLESVLLFNKFLTLCMAQITPFIQIEIELEDSYDEENTNVVKLIFANDDYKYNYRPEQTILNYSSISKYFPQIIKKWYEENNNLGPITDYLINSIIPTQTFGYSNFMKVAIALEGYYIRTISDERDYKKTINNLIAKFKDIDILTDDKIDSEAVADTRNTFAHLLDKKKKKHFINDSLKLYEQTWYLRKLLTCCVISHVLGVDNHLILNEILNISNCWMLQNYKGEQ